MNYGKTIKDFRVDRMKQRQCVFAENVGITQTYLSQIENGKKKPSTELLERISNFIDVPLPIMFWNSITEQDIAPEKIEAFRVLQPSINRFINTFIPESTQNGLL